MGYIAAHGHSGTLGWSPARWPNLVAFGQPMPVERGQRASSVRLACTTRGHHFRARRGAGLNSAAEGYWWRGLWLVHPHGSGYKPLHGDLEEVAGEGVCNIPCYEILN
jgi:hypothetical protein